MNTQRIPLVSPEVTTENASGRESLYETGEVNRTKGTASAVP